jgi:hypothetical protein
VRPVSRLAGPAGAAQLPLYRGGHPATPGIRRPLHDFRSRPTTAGRVIDWIIVGLMLLAVVSMFAVSSSLLTNLKVHYLTAGGGFYEKLHPATYLTLFAWLLLLMRNGDPIGEINRSFSDAKLMLIYLFCWVCLLIQMFVLDRPFTVIIDTFLLPLLLCLVIWRLTASQRKPLVWAIHLTILLNVVLGYYEYFSGHHLIPLTVGDVVVLGEWRSSALLGHPLTASGIVGGYILALVLRPALCSPIILRLPLIAFCLGSLMAFGGRTALVTVLSIIGLIFCFEIFRLLRGGRTSLPMVIGAMCVLFIAAAGIFAALDLGIFDKMLLRFSSDKGSTLARYATFSLLSHFDWYELVLGPNPVRVSALQSQLGLNYGIENFWISSAVQFGLVHTALLTIGLVAFFVEMLRRSTSDAYAIVLLVLVIAASSVSFSSKNIQLAQFIVLVALLFPREPSRAADASHYSPRKRSDARLNPR